MCADGSVFGAAFHTIMLSFLYVFVPACVASSRVILLTSTTFCLVSKAMTGLSLLRKRQRIFPDLFPQLITAVPTSRRRVKYRHVFISGYCKIATVNCMIYVNANCEDAETVALDSCVL
jgi:hypothetical protein